MPIPFAGARDRQSSLIVLLVLLTVLPAVCVLWLLSEAVQAQAAASRRVALEGYRAQLRLVRSRVDSYWDARAAQIAGTDHSARRFASLLASDEHDGVLLLDEYGRVSHPAPDTTRTAAAAAIEQQLNRAERMEPGAARDAAVAAIAGTLNDYTQPLAPQRRARMMAQLRDLDVNLSLPTQAALELSLELAAMGGLALEPGVFQQTALRDVWAFTASDGRTVLLYRTGRIEAMMHDLLHEVTPSGILFVTFAPDRAADAEAITAGSALPGWQLSFFEPLDTLPVDDAAGRRRTMAYVAVAAFGLAATLLIAVVTGSAFRRHLRLAQMKTDLVASVSHELRTPLASMRVLVDGLLADARLDETKTRDYLQLLSSENARLTRLIEDFLAFSRLERGGERFVFTAVAPSAVVEAAIGAMRERQPPDGRVELAIDPDLPPIRADENAAVAALINLLDNAVKYSPGHTRVTLRVERSGDGVAFRVQDKGIGIPAREHRRIFRRFYRVDQRLTRETGGVGLGLSIVDLIARAHGGSISVQSVEGAGSTFTLHLPCASGAPA